MVAMVNWLGNFFCGSDGVVVRGMVLWLQWCSSGQGTFLWFRWCSGQEDGSVVAMV